MNHFFEDGCSIHLDNNAIENKIRHLVEEKLLICRFPRGGKKDRYDVFLFASCKEVDVNPYAWMTDTLNRIGNHPINKLSDLLPSNFQKL